MLLPLKILFFLIFLSLIFLIIYLLSKSNWLKRRFLFDLIEFFSFKPYGMGKVPRLWEKILKRFGEGEESEFKLAIIEADDLLNEVLIKMGYSGETLGENLGEVKKEILPNLDDVLEIHRIKSHIVHDPTYQLDMTETKRILEIYERALINLEAL